MDCNVATVAPVSSPLSRIYGWLYFISWQWLDWWTGGHMTVWVAVTGTNYVTVGERSTAFMVISNPVPTSQHSQGFCYLLDLGFPGEQRHPKYKIVHLSISPIPFLECSIAVSASARLSMEIAIHQHFSRTIFVER